MKKAYIFLADGFEEIEALTPLDLLRRAGIDCKTVSLNGSPYVTGSHAIIVKADLLWEEAPLPEVDCLLLPGGPGTENLRRHAGLVALLKQYYQQAKLIGAICAAPSILGELGFLFQKQATCYPGYEASLLGASVGTAPVYQYENIITSRGAGTAIPFSLALIAALENKQTAETIKEKILYTE